MKREITRNTENADKLLSIVVPTYNEAAVLNEFYNRTAAVIDIIEISTEIIFVNDGSSDNSINLLHSLRESDPRIAIVDLSRNFGKEIALTAGLDHAGGDAVIVIDADLQDPPELIPDLIKEWHNGHDVVYAQRIVRNGESYFKKVTAHLFYRLIRHSTGRVSIPSDTGDFRLLSRRALDTLLVLREQHRFMKGLFAWIGYPQKAVQYKRCPRYAGDSKWNYWALWNFAIEGITSFTTSPLRAATYLGLLTAGGAFLYGFVMIVKTLFFGNAVPGYPSLMVVILFLGGVQLIAIGVIGEYLGRMFDETKRRPLYVVQEYTPSSQAFEASRDVKSVA